MRRFLGQQKWLVVILAVAAIARISVLTLKADALKEDRDAYLAIAHSLAEGNGYIHPATKAPTAYRPPLYPVMLAVLFALGGDETAIAVLHFVCGLGTVLLTWLIGTRIGNDSVGLVAASFVAIDPLLVGYSIFSMTETVFTFLVTLLSAFALNRLESKSGQHTNVRSRRTEIIIGVMFGLCALCRPTIWAFGILMTIYWVVALYCGHKREGSNIRQLPLWMLAAIALTTSPWIIRNVIVFREPIAMTTHGGYTLLLGNNPVFYREVVALPWVTVWDDAAGDSSQSAWYQRLQDELIQAGINPSKETRRDRWMLDRAINNIRSDPDMFVMACWLRLRRFWNVTPGGRMASSFPRVAIAGIGLFYCVMLVNMLIGIVRILRRRAWEWVPLFLLIVSFSAVHTVYWSNMRMRAPLIPAIALISAVGLFGTARSNDDQSEPKPS